LSLHLNTKHFLQIRKPNVLANIQYIGLPSLALMPKLHRTLVPSHMTW